MAILLGSVDICIKTKPQKRCTEKIFLLVLLVFSMALAMKTVRINAIELESESVQSEENLISGKKLVFGNENLADEIQLYLSCMVMVLHETNRMHFIQWHMKWQSIL